MQTNSEIEKKIFEENLKKMMSQAKCIPIRKLKGKDGKVPVYLYAEGKIVRREPVDVREILERGLGTIEPVQVVKDGVKMTIGVDQFEAYANNGYVLEGQESSTTTQPAETVDFGQFSDDVIAQFADLAGLPKTIKKRETIIEKLKELGFDPAKAGTQ